MMFRSIALATTMSLLSVAVSTTAHAGENTTERDAAANPETPPGAVLAGMPSRRPAPELSPLRVTGEVLAGTAVGAGLAVGSGYLLYQAIGDDCSESGTVGEALECGFKSTILPGLLGAVVYPAGVGMGVALVGDRGDVQGSTGLALTGAYLGSAAGFLIGGYVVPDRWAGTGMVVGFLAGAPIGAAIGYNWDLDSRQPRTGLVNVSGSRTRMSIPAVSVTADPLRPQSTVTSIRLMDGRF
jgi:hypothetical protein